MLWRKHVNKGHPIIIPYTVHGFYTLSGGNLMNIHFTNDIPLFYNRFYMVCRYFRSCQSWHQTYQAQRHRTSIISSAVKITTKGKPHSVLSGCELAPEMVEHIHSWCYNYHIMKGIELQSGYCVVTFCLSDVRTSSDHHWKLPFPIQKQDWGDCTFSVCGRMPRACRWWISCSSEGWTAGPEECCRNQLGKNVAV